MGLEVIGFAESKAKCQAPISGDSIRRYELIWNDGEVSFACSYDFGDIGTCGHPECSAHPRNRRKINSLE